MVSFRTFVYSLNTPQLLYFSLYTNYYNGLKRDVITINKPATANDIIGVAARSKLPMHFSILSNSIWHDDVVDMKQDILRILLSRIQAGMPIAHPNNQLFSKQDIENRQKKGEAITVTPNELTKFESLVRFLESLELYQLKLLCFLLNLNKWEKPKNWHWQKQRFVSYLSKAIFYGQHKRYLNEQETLWITLPIVLLNQYRDTCDLHGKTDKTLVTNELHDYRDEW